jgi:chromosome segregation protein
MHHAEAGILFRKSELRELREQVSHLELRLVEMDRDLAELRDRVVILDAEAETQQQEIDALTEQAGDLRSRIGQHRQRREGLHEEVTLSQSEISGIEGDIKELNQAWERAQDQAARAEAEVQALHNRMETAEREIREGAGQREALQQRCTAAKVALAQLEERREALRARHRQIAADLEQRQQEHQHAEANFAGAHLRLTESQRTMLQASMALANLFLDKEAAEIRLANLNVERGHQRAQRQQVLEQSQTARAAWQTQQEQAHGHELQVNNLRNRRDTLVERLREDYQIDLAELFDKVSHPGTDGAGEAVTGVEGASSEKTGETPEDAAPSDYSVGLCASLIENLDPNQANEEIADLRRKLSRLGSVNLEALQELNELETRAQTLQGQYDDLAAAKNSLEEIINTINADSRRLFSETLETIRLNFQELFRKLFGGGMADIVLEDETDILESGIDIIARPPGKELRSISLMSGGEKTLTAVALLLAIFRSKPSPFCILDEVDAALDEANIGRFTAVLRDFLDRSHFILITHSKRTMAAADVLYGITMQESGISKRVAVRFEDWPDEETPAENPPQAQAG